MLQLLDVFEVSFGVWRFRGLWRDPAPDCKTPLDQVIPHFANANTHPHENLDRLRSGLQLPRRVSYAVFKGSLHSKVEKVEGRK
ncbi:MULTISPECIES: hypothetical protein [unclassified Neorhizobium]|uniref:hypothetical protein n=1 Tax=unclassified Neorhizobium TaxID=2629175 RepID=UPI001FF4BC0D|nr:MULTISPECIES: hypothetical protein [unclassified Neorhizobium]MCJ9672820.1 hypothetical protein [Neorhizobium sp. SHOUNA12B]MCJ9748455.1 hypothetical protein [Neorhizobium sp. SHOUNA12A]